MTISTEDLCRLMAQARAHSVSEFSYGELSFKLGDIPSTAIEATDNLGRRQDDLRQAAVEAKLREADELALTDPERYEELLERSLTGERSEPPEMVEEQL